MRNKSFKYKLLRVGISAATLSILLLTLVNVLAVRSFSANKTASSEFSKAIAAQRIGLPARLEGDCPTPVLEFRFIEASPNSIVKGGDGSRNKGGRFISTDLSQRRTRLSNYGTMDWQADLGSDAIFYGKHFRLPHLRLEGAEELLVDSDGNLRIRMGDSQELCMQKPFIYQFVQGEKVRVDAQFTLVAKNEIGFEIGHYDESQVLVIDPMFVYRA